MTSSRFSDLAISLAQHSGEQLQCQSAGNSNQALRLWGGRWWWWCPTHRDDILTARPVLKEDPVLGDRLSFPRDGVAVSSPGISMESAADAKTRGQGFPGVRTRILPTAPGPGSRRGTRGPADPMPASHRYRGRNIGGPPSRNIRAESVSRYGAGSSLFGSSPNFCRR